MKIYFILIKYFYIYILKITVLNYTRLIYLLLLKIYKLKIAYIFNLNFIHFDWRILQIKNNVKSFLNRFFFLIIIHLKIKNLNYKWKINKLKYLPIILKNVIKLKNIIVYNFKMLKKYLGLIIKIKRFLILINLTKVWCLIYWSYKNTIRKIWIFNWNIIHIN